MEGMMELAERWNTRRDRMSGEMENMEFEGQDG